MIVQASGSWKNSLKPLENARRNRFRPGHCRSVSYAPGNGMQMAHEPDKRQMEELWQN
jgi:hypothetical protein